MLEATAIHPPRSAGLVIAALVALGATLPGCGGGGSGSGGSGGTATAALLIGDAPPTEIEGFTVTVERASLLGPGGPVLLFEGERRVDLLDHRDQEFLLSLCEVPAGTYEKIRLEIRDPEVSPNPNDWPVFVPGNGKLDLNPRGEFTIAAGESIAIRIDVDVARSVHVVLTGNQRFIVRPVIFVDIERGNRSPIPVADLAGTVIAVDAAADTADVDLDLSAGVIAVVPGADARVFDEDLLLVPFGSLAVGDRVLLRGRIDSTGGLVADAVLIGEPLRVRGGLPDGTADPTWGFEPDPGAAIAGTVTATVVEGALATIEDGSAIDPMALPTGSRARLTGRYFIPAGLLRAALLDLETEEVTGTIVALDLAATPPRFTLEDELAAVAEIALAPETELRLAGGGDVPTEFLAAGLDVEVAIAGTLGGLPRAWTVRIEPELREGVVTAVDVAGESITIQPEGAPPAELFLRPDARVLRVDGADCAEIALADVLPGDAVEAFGLRDSGGAFRVWLLVVLP